LPTHFFIMDASALIAGQVEVGENTRLATTTGILEEVHSQTTQVRIAGWLDAGILMPMEPAPEFIAQAKAAATKSGDLRVLSPNDLALLALALDVIKNHEGATVTMLSGDFAIENTAKFLNVKVDSISPGIKKTIQWEWYCPACHKRGFKNPNARECDVCGTPLKRRDSAHRQDRQRSQKPSTQKLSTQKPSRQ